MFPIFLIAVCFIFLNCTTYPGAKKLIGEASSQIWSNSDIYDPADVTTLSLTPGDDFKILVLADIQLGSNPFKDSRSLEIIETLVNRADADLILTVGDNVSWIFAHSLTMELIEKLDSFDTPWAVTLGNHDSEGQADRFWHGNRYAEGRAASTQSSHTGGDNTPQLPTVY